MSGSLTTRIPIKDRNGNVVSEKEVATYAGLLARAHEEGLRTVRTDVIQFPTDDNGRLCIVKATVETGKGTFEGIGDASPDNVNPRIIPHTIRMAETRAKARALRDAVNIGVVSLEELGGEDEGDAQPVAPRAASNVRPLRPQANGMPDRTRTSATRTPSNEDQRDNGARPDPMTENQRRLLLRMLAEAGYEPDDAVEALCSTANVRDVRQISKHMASRIIETWKAQGIARAS